jgi:hypothetical protein
MCCAGLGGNCLEQDDTQVLQLDKKKLILMSEEEVCSSLGSLSFRPSVYKKLDSTSVVKHVYFYAAPAPACKKFRLQTKI